MTDVGVQVVGKIRKGKEIQMELSFLECKNVGMQCSEHEGEGSYQHKKCNKNGYWTYDKLKDEVLSSKNSVLSWLMERKLIANRRLCPQCDGEMKLVECNDISDGCKRECRKQ